MTCLYNGVPLPALPTVRHCDYLGRDMDYAIIKEITEETGTTYRAHFFPGQLIYKKDNSGFNCLFVAEGSDLSYYCSVRYNYENGGWVKESDTHESVIEAWEHWNVGVACLQESDANKTIWTSHTIVNADTGGIYLAASDPVPQLNPAALMQGFFVGEAVKRCRR